MWGREGSTDCCIAKRGRKHLTLKCCLFFLIDNMNVFVWALRILNYLNFLIFKCFNYKLRTRSKRAWAIWRYWIPRAQEGWNIGFRDWLDGLGWSKVMLRSKRNMKSFNISLLAYSEEIIFLGWITFYRMLIFVGI